MKAVLVVIMTLMFGAASAAQNGILGSAHDFSKSVWNMQKMGEVCGVCHVPHVENRSSSQTGKGLLWGRSLSMQTNYKLYSSTSLVGTITQPDGSTKLCLGCHDGSVALEHFAGNTTTGSTLIPGRVKVPGLPLVGPGTDLSGDHPVSIVYVPGNSTRLRVTTSQFGSRTIQNALEETPPASGTFKVQCRTCHDIHNRDIQVGASNLLRVTMVGSALCLACHDM